MDPLFTGIFGGVDPFAAINSVAATAAPATGNSGSSSGGFLSGFLDTVNTLGTTAANGYKTYLAATSADKTAAAAANAAAAKSNASATWSKYLPVIAIGSLIVGGIVLVLFFVKRK